MSTKNKPDKKEVFLSVDSVLSYLSFKTARQIKHEVNEMLERQGMPKASLTDIRAALSQIDKDCKLRVRKKTDAYALPN